MLSQQLSQLSTHDQPDHLQEYSSGGQKKKRSLSTPSTSPDVVVSKKMRVYDDHEQQEEVSLPEYLQTTSDTFRQFISSDTLSSDTMMTTTSTFTEHDIQQLTALKHKIAALNIDRKLWTIYLKSNTSQCKTVDGKDATNVIDPQVWPMPVIKILLSNRKKTTDINEAKDHEPISDSLVRAYLEEINSTMSDYRDEFNQKKQQFTSFTDEMEKAMEAFVQQHGIQSLQMEWNNRIATLQYECDVQLFECEYRQLQPTEQQVRSLRHFPYERYAFEISFVSHTD